MSKPTIKPFWSTTDNKTVRLYHGDAIHILSSLPPKSVHMVVTSPPYWGLRDYQVEGQLGAEPKPDCGTHGNRQCGGCFVCSMVGVFCQVKRVLRDDGTLWLNLGDTYSGGGGGNYGNGKNASYGGETYLTNVHNRNHPLPYGNLVGVPWRVAIALQADGWILRQDIIWAKPNPMPESVKNRCTKAHEYVFLFSKGMGYYCDMEGIKEPLLHPNLLDRKGWGDTKKNHHGNSPQSMARHGDGRAGSNPSGSNKRSVWTVVGKGYKGTHFATYPVALIEPMIRAGTSERGCCTDCGVPHYRVTISTKLKRPRPNDYVKRTGEEGTGNSCSNSVAGVDTRTIGWYPTCQCDLPPLPKEPDPEKQPKAHAQWLEKIKQPLEWASQLEVQPCVVLDPFIGSGTTCKVAIDLERWSIGVDLSEQYLMQNAIPRIEGCLGSRPITRGLVPSKPSKKFTK